MTTIVFEAWPLGCCSECLTQWRDRGLPGQGQVLADGDVLLSGYCPHHKAGFYTVVSTDGVAREWSIRVPVGAEDWTYYLTTMLPAVFAGVSAAAADSGPAPTEH